MILIALHIAENHVLLQFISGRCAICLDTGFWFMFLFEVVVFSIVWNMRWWSNIDFKVWTPIGSSNIIGTDPNHQTSHRDERLWALQIWRFRGIQLAPSRFCEAGTLCQHHRLWDARGKCFISKAINHYHRQATWWMVVHWHTWSLTIIYYHILLQKLKLLTASAFLNLIPQKITTAEAVVPC